MRSLAIALTFAITFGCAASLLAQRASCGPTQLPKDLPAVSALIDSTGALTEFAAAKVLRDSMEFTLLMLPGDSIPLLAPLDSGDAIAAAVLARSLWPEKPGALWGVRVRVAGRTSPAITLARATYCPPELMPGQSAGLVPVERIEHVGGRPMIGVTPSSGPVILGPGSSMIFPKVTKTRPVNAILEVEVNARGLVRNVKVIRLTGYPAADREIIRDFGQKKFEPALLDGVPVPSVYRTDNKSPHP